MPLHLHVNQQSDYDGMVFFLVLQSSHLGRENCILAFMCIYLCLYSNSSSSWCHGSVCVCCISWSYSLVFFSYLPSESGTEIITPFPVPIQRRLLEINIDVILTNENPNFPVPVKEIQT